MIKAQKIIRVLIVDDSALARDLLRSILEEDPGISVIGEAVNGMEAIAKVAALKPDLVTMDIEMPVMGGLEAIERIMAAQPVPILVVTALTGVRTAFSAIAKGALDVIEKPDVSLEHVEKLHNKIRFLARVDVSAQGKAKTLQEKPKAFSAAPASQSAAKGVLAIASSTGGPQAIYSVLAQLPATFPLPIVIAQHIASGFTQGMADWLNAGTALSVTVAASGVCLVPGRVYVNPAEHTMRVTEQGLIILGARPADQIYQPSCDTLLSSIAASYRQGAIGLIMSGMGDDGVEGIQAIKLAGGMTLAQDGASSIIYGMNRIAVECGYIQRIVPLAGLAAELMQRTGTK